MSSQEDKPPIVFISYSHDSPEHKRWVLEFAKELRLNGIDCKIDVWDSRPGDDLVKFMERGVRDSDRVLMICTEKYTAKANDGVGGAGYEAMIVTAQLVQDLGTAKFVPIIRQNTAKPVVPTSVSTRKYINLNDGPGREAEMKTLLLDLHNVPPEKPPLGPSPFKKANPTPTSLPSPPEIPVEKAEARALAADEETKDPVKFFRAALRIAESGEVLKWRRTVASARQLITPELKAWSKKYATTHPDNIDTLIEQTMEGVSAFAPLTAIALAGVASGQPKFANQMGLLEDILNPSEWQLSGFVVRGELPKTGAFLYQALLGSTSVYMRNVRSAIDMVRTSTVNSNAGKTMPLWARHDIIGWPESLGKTATKAWETALAVPTYWPWVHEVFSDLGEYQAALYAYYVTMSFVEFVEGVRKNMEIPENPRTAHWWPDVPVFFEITDSEIKQRGYQLLLEEKEALHSWLSEMKVDEARLLAMWPKWVKVQAIILASERPMRAVRVKFERLLQDVLGK